MQFARAVIAGNIMMLIALWVMLDKHRTTEETLGAVVLGLITLLFILGFWVKVDKYDE